MNNQNKILIGIAITYFLTVIVVASKLTQSTRPTTKNEDDELKEQKKE
tara:strand:- start:477 stop:620 length:144 start_codon:yes stop_codon:yes gene_type:complete